jgi:hypothetical protein
MNIELIGHMTYTRKKVGSVTVIESDTTYTLPLDELSEAYAKAMQAKDSKQMAIIRRHYKFLADCINEEYDINLLTVKKQKG